MSDTPPSNETPEMKDIRLNKDVAALSYIGILSVIIFAWRKDSPFIQFHSKQGIVLFIASIPLLFVPFIGNVLLLIVIAGALLGFINAATGKRSDVPFVGPLSRGEMTFSELFSTAGTKAKQAADALKETLREPKRDDHASAASPPPTNPPHEDKTS